MSPTQSLDFRPSASQAAITAEAVPRIPHIMNVALTVASTWYEIKFPFNTVTWMMKARGAFDILYSYEPTASTYMTIASGNTLSEDTIPNRSIGSIFVSCATAGVVVELELWLYA